MGELADGDLSGKDELPFKTAVITVVSGNFELKGTFQKKKLN